MIAFEKLENFNNYKITLNDEKNKITPTKYSVSDNIYFKNLINNSSNSNENILADKKKKIQMLIIIQSVMIATLKELNNFHHKQVMNL